MVSDKQKKGFNRRDFLKVLGVGTGLAASGCASEVPEKIIPYVIQPDEEIQGHALWYTGTCNDCSAACGVLVRTKGGRALKVEGNPKHPVNRGGLCAIGQSSIQAHYDPDRVREPLSRVAGSSFYARTWTEVIQEVSSVVGAVKASGKKLVVFSKPLGSSEEELLNLFADSLGSKFSHYEYELLSDVSLRLAAEDLYGKPLKTHFDFSKAETILSVGADFLETWISPVKFAKDFAVGRAPEQNSKGEISKFYHIEPRLSLTGGNADVWLKNAPGTEVLILKAIVLSLLAKGAGASPLRSEIKQLVADLVLEDLLQSADLDKDNFDEMIDSLLKSKSSIVVAGGASVSSFAREAAKLAFLINELLGNMGKSVTFSDQAPNKYKKFVDSSVMNSLIGEMKSGEVGALFFVDTNPAFSLPAKSGFLEALSKVPTVVSCSKTLDETAQVSQVVLPLSSNFESWNDSEPLPGVFALNQPAMQALFESQGFGDILLSLAASKELKLNLGLKDVGSFYDYIILRWKGILGATDFQSKWDKVLEDGGKFDAKLTASSASIASSSLAEIFTASSKKVKSGLTFIAYPTVSFRDGIGANRPWMQEVPDPMTTAVWGSWIELHPDVASSHGVSHGKVIQLRTPQGNIEAPAYINPRLHRDVIAMPIGQGHQTYGRFASGVGSNALAVTSLSGNSFVSLVTGGVSIAPSVAKDELVQLQFSDSQLERGFIRQVSVDKLNAPDDVGHSSGGHHDPLALGPREAPKQMYKQMEHPVYRWGMSIDLSACTGCSACVVACYAENNIAVVGKQVCSQGREMSWIKITRYFDGPETQPVSGFAPMLCQHCNNAPCEPVCPVYATYHSEDGLNTMVYNRCVGTRYCSNNCSYKVRRFNYFNFEWPEPLNWQLNPDITTRSVGVMEKCSFCIQRIRGAQNTAKNEGRLVEDGEIQPACASSCPTNAITFGNLLDEESEVSKNHLSPRGYKVLDFELNTQPAIAYLAKVTHEDNSEKNHHGGHHEVEDTHSGSSPEAAGAHRDGH